ncbi:transglycosylase SLT domain-containing protein [Nocardia iowensis]|uniref:Transglycosylase SLT domain-containing protein n=1 Tax=Nocardia iowensis TaxID=204891 RepID=A0ABX8RKV8_NOCIO|nr:transglycosylase SLT domain-containing protein [Nocardia iowensis]QXN90263.1 transglycosylase SLT domain-containing protein [Nocardia iowensis]
MTVVPELARDFVDRLRGQLLRIRENLSVRIVPNLGEFATELRTRLARLRNFSVRVRPVPDLDGFAARFNAALAPFRGRVIRIRIEIDNSQLLLLLQLLAQLTRAGGPAGMSMARLGSVLSLASVAAGVLKAALMGLVLASLFPLVAVAAQAAGTLGLLPAAAAAAAAGIATIAVGVSGVKDAFAAAKQMSETTGKDAETHSRAIASAQRGEQQATRAVTWARTDLNRAYADAAKRLRDLELQARGAALNESDALLSIAEARRDLAQLQSTDPLEYVRANQRVAEAEQQLLEVRARRADIDEQAADAQRKGIGDADEVVAAREHLADAETQLADARTAVAEASAQMSPAVEVFERAVAKLAPAAQDFVTQIRGLGSEWTRFRMAVQQPLFNGLGDSVVRLADAQLERVREGLAGIAAAINAGVRRVLDDLATPATGDKLEKIFTNAQAAIGPLIDGVNDLLQGLLSLAGVGSEFLPDTSRTFADTMASFRAWAESPAGQQKFRDFLTDSLDALDRIWELAKSIGKALAGLIMTAEPSGESMIESLVRNLDRFSAWLNSPEGRQAMRDFWEDVRTTVTNLASLAVWIGQAAEKVYEFLDAIRDLSGINIFQGALFTLIEQLEKVPERFDKIREWLNEHLPSALGGAALSLTGFGDSLDGLRGRVSSIVSGIGDAWDGLRERTAAPINWVIEHVVNGGFRAAWNAIRTVVPVLTEWNGEVPLIPITGRARGGPASKGRVTGPGSRTSDSVPALLSRDEHVWTGAEVDAVGGHGAMLLLRRSALAGQLPGFRDGGGLFGSVTDWVGDRFASVAAGVRAKIADLFLTPVQALADTVPDFGGGIGELPRAALAQVTDSAAEVIAGRTAGLRAAADARAALPPGEGVQRWRAMAIEALKRVGFDPAQVDIMLSQIESESGGDPDIAQQIVDINGTGESAGVGLLQIIPGTFAAHRDPELPNDRRDPFANMVAALRYYKSRYGMDLSQMWGHGHGYDSGGLWEPGTLGWNTSGKTEAVLTNDEWRWLRELIDSRVPLVPGQQKPGLDDPARKGLGLDTWESLGQKATETFSKAGMEFLSGQLDDALSVVGTPNPLNSERVRALQAYQRSYEVFEATKAARAAGAADYQSLMNQAAPPPVPTVTSPAGPMSNIDNSTHITVQTRDVDEGYRRAQQIADLRALQYTARG